MDAESMISKLLKDLPDAASAGIMWTPTDFIKKIDMCLEEIESVATNFTLYSNNSTDGKHTLGSSIESMNKIIVMP